MTGLERALEAAIYDALIEWAKEEAKGYMNRIMPPVRALLREHAEPGPDRRVSPAPSADAVDWVQQADYDWELWRCGGCGEEWQFNEGTPKENGVHFCHNCGKKIRAFIPLDEPDDEGAALAGKEP